MMKKIFFAVWMIILGAAMATSAGAPVKAVVESGTIVGESNDGVNIFWGVPYAKPPVADLRWAPPGIPDNWEGERDATKPALPCIQPTDPDGKTRNGGGVCGETSEDCLYLNIFAPTKAENAPVMVWLHGGASFLGAGHLGGYNGTNFAKQGIIIVTINYRLGPLGYFAHHAITKATSPVVPLASYGLMDAVSALDWVQRNIEQFGGNKKNVTVFGQSAGGGMVVSLISIPSAKGLFAKAGIHSGASLRPGRSLSDAEKSGADIADKLGLPGEKATLEQLRAVPASDFTKDRIIARGGGSPIDGRFKTTSTVDAFENGCGVVDVPLFVGSNNGERGFNNARKVASYMSGGAPSFLYQFAYVPEWQKSERPNGAPHSAEIAYAYNSWDYTAWKDSRVTEKDLEVAKQMNSCWVAFAKADVNVDSLTCADGFVWPRYDDKTDNAAVFAETPKLVKSKTLPDGPPRNTMQRGSMAPN